jgi:hypothetical protein
MHRARMKLGLTDRSQRDPPNGSEKHTGTPHFPDVLAMHSTCPECRVSAAMHGFSPLPNHALGKDGTWSHGLVASRPIEWQQETLGSSPFPCVYHGLCNMHVRRGCNSQIRVVILEDLHLFNSTSIFNRMNPSSPQHS